MGRKHEPRFGGRLNTPNFIKTPSRPIKNVDYSPESKILELEWRDESGNDKIYHYLNVEKNIYQKILKLKTTIDSLPKPLTEELKNKHSIGNFVALNVRDKYDYYELNVIN